jgi:hypothetical protein
MIRKQKPRKLQLEQFNQLWVVEYSVEQNAFNVRTVNEMLENNRKNLAGRISTDYVPIAFTVNHEKAIALSESLRDNISQQIKVDAKRAEILMFSEDDLWAFFRTLDSEEQ